MKNEDVREFLKFRNKFTKEDWTDLNNVALYIENKRFTKLKLDENDADVVEKFIKYRRTGEDVEEQRSHNQHKRGIKNIRLGSSIYKDGSKTR